LDKGKVVFPPGASVEDKLAFYLGADVITKAAARLIDDAGVGDATRVTRLKVIAHDLDTLERYDEALVRRATYLGRDVLRRSTADPAAVLSVRRAA
jgi:hypothetical protein